jgi:homoserine dehydrogenase
MPDVEVLKLGSSVLRSHRDLHVAVDEIYRRWRSGCRVLAVVSAFEGITDELIAEVVDVLGVDCPEATAAYVATGEQKTAALLSGSLQNSGIPSRIIDPREIGLIAEGSCSESTPVRVDVDVLDQLWSAYPVLVLPGFYGIDSEGRIALFGRGGSDLSALFLAAALDAECRLGKDVMGVYDTDPASSTLAHRFSALSWERAIQVAGPLIQSKALRYAQSRALTFEVGRPNEAACTRVGHTHDEWAAATQDWRPLRIALLGCGVVGRGVYEAVRRYPHRYELRHVVVRDISRYPGVAGLTADLNAVLDDSIDVVIECFDGAGLAYPLVSAALFDGKFVITANKAATTQRWQALAHYARGADRRLWYSAAVAGAVPVIETIATLPAAVLEIRGIVNATSGVVLDALAQGSSREEAIAIARAGGFAETDSSRDLSGRDSADKLALLIDAAFGTWIPPEQIATLGIDAIEGTPAGYKLIARARRTASGITASVQPELTPSESFLGQASGAENRIEIELANGETVRLRGQGAGRWPTATSVMGDLHEVARLVESTRRAPAAAPRIAASC